MSEAQQNFVPGQLSLSHRGDMPDVYLSDNAYGKQVPIQVREYRLGGYQVPKKWLSYRESKVLERRLTVWEVGCFEEVAHRVGEKQAAITDQPLQ